jgi:hypothetical protein
MKLRNPFKPKTAKEHTVLKLEQNLEYLLAKPNPDAKTQKKIASLDHTCNKLWKEIQNA